MKPETAWTLVGCVAGGLVGFDLLPSVTVLIFMAALATWLVSSERRQRRSLAVGGPGISAGDGTDPTVTGIGGASASASRVLLGGMACLAIGVAGRLMDVW